MWDWAMPPQPMIAMRSFLPLYAAFLPAIAVETLMLLSAMWEPLLFWVGDVPVSPSARPAGRAPRRRIARKTAPF